MPYIFTTFNVRLYGNPSIEHGVFLILGNMSFETTIAKENDIKT